MWITTSDFCKLVDGFFPLGSRNRKVREWCMNGTIKAKVVQNTFRSTYWININDIASVLRDTFELEEDEIAVIQGRTRVNFNRLELVS